MPMLASSKVLEVILDRISQGVVLYDGGLVITGLNRAAEKLLGIHADAVVGQPCRELFNCGACGDACPLKKAAARQGHGLACFLPLHSLTQDKTASVMPSPVFDESGTLAGGVVWIQDVREGAGLGDHQLIFRSDVMKELSAFAREVGASDVTTLLIEGESGAGKDSIAKSIHYNSRRRAEAFVTFNCAIASESLLETELFGYEQAPFPTALPGKRGIIEVADHGTLLLDEVDEIPLALQAKLLHTIENRSVRRLGATRDCPVDVRIICTTSRNLRDAVRTGAFRKALFFRLNVIQIAVPPLRQRPEDILPLATFFLERYNRRFKRDIRGLSENAAALLMAHSWPGNVRELRDAIERAMLLEESDLITPSRLPLTVTRPGPDELAAGEGRVSEENLSLKEHEELLLMRALERTAGNQTRAARLLNISRDTLRYRMKKYGLT
jgi:transcriptional regulator with PAS, ATPase and Fis domain